MARDLPPMRYTRRDFLSAAAAAGIGGSVGCSSQPAPANRLSGAPGVELGVDDVALPDYSHDLEQYLVRIANEARDRRKQVISAISTRQQIADRQKSGGRHRLADARRTFRANPLNPRVTGVVERPGYRIEKVAFESRPRLYVTANLYVPAAAGRHPAILGPLGHSVNGKAWPSYQKLFSNLARKGYVVLAYDPFGQGERIEYPGTRPGESAIGPGGTSEHEYAGRRLILLGANFGLFRAWDGIRGIDYLLTRAEVDAGTDRLLRSVRRRHADAVPGGARQPDQGRRGFRGQHREPGARQRRAARLGRRCRAEHRAGALAWNRPRRPALRVRAEAAARHGDAPRRGSHLFAGVRRQLARLRPGIHARLQPARGRQPGVASGDDRTARIRLRNAPGDLRLVQSLVRDEGCRRRRNVAGGGAGRDALRDANRLRDHVVWRGNGAFADATDGRSCPDAGLARRRRGAHTHSDGARHRGAAWRAVGGARSRHHPQARIPGRTVRIHERSGDSHAGLAADTGQRRTFDAHRAVRRRGSGLELRRGGRVCRAPVRQGRMPRRGDRRPRPRRLRHRLSAARPLLLSESHSQRSLPDVVRLDARQASARRTGV